MIYSVPKFITVIVLESSILGHSRKEFHINYENLQKVVFFVNHFNKDKSVGQTQKQTRNLHSL